MTTFCVAGRMRIWRHRFALRYEDTDAFWDVRQYFTRQEAESRLATLQALAAKINTPPFPFQAERQRLMAQAGLTTQITELTCLKIVEVHQAFETKEEHEQHRHY